MLKFYGEEPPEVFSNLRPGGICPHCKEGARFGNSSSPIPAVLRRDKITTFVASYYCELCLGPIPIQWDIDGWRDANNPVVDQARLVLPVREPFDFDHVPVSVEREIEEALACLSVTAYSGFAALCRRSVQAICTELGAEGSSKVQKQIKEMIELTGLGNEWEELTVQIMLSGHDGAHPHLPEVGNDRAAVLLSLLRDLCYELFTRPGNVKAAAAMRADSIKKSQ